MKSVTALVLTIALIATCAAFVADDSFAASGSSQPEFPSFSEIIQEFRMPDYTLDRFINDTKTMFSQSMFEQMGRYGSDLFKFIAEDTFVADIGSGNLSEAFSDGNYINYFVLICFIIAAICVLGAFITYFLNRKTFLMERRD